MSPNARITDTAKATFHCFSHRLNECALYRNTEQIAYTRFNIETAQAVTVLSAPLENQIESIVFLII